MQVATTHVRLFGEHKEVCLEDNSLYIDDAWYGEWEEKRAMFRLRTPCEGTVLGYASPAELDAHIAECAGLDDMDAGDEVRGRGWRCDSDWEYEGVSGYSTEDVCSMFF